MKAYSGNLAETHCKKAHPVHWPNGHTIEGFVYRVERKGKVDFLAKWVRPTRWTGSIWRKTRLSGTSTG